MPTPHIAAEPGDFAPEVLMPGDPRRAKLVAERFFDKPRLVTEVRGILGYTGEYRGRPISILASGMGMPSVSIYATELARFYGVKRVIRIGTVGGMAPQLELGDVVAASAAHTDSNMTGLRLPGVNFSHAPAFTLLRAAVEHGERTGARLHVGSVFTSDAFYHPDQSLTAKLGALGTLAVEMEAAGLYAVGAAEGIETLMLGTVSDLLDGRGEMTAAERETTFAAMAELALAAIHS